MDYSKIKIVSVTQKIDDLPGLYRDLKAALFGVVNVASDERGTYLYLEQSERKDPRPIVQSWVGKKPNIQSPTTSWLGLLFRKIW